MRAAQRLAHRDNVVRIRHPQSGTSEVRNLRT